MNAKLVGKTIAMLRRKKNMTQSQLAAKLNISDKTVSKWESGAGFPEVTQFPVIASLFDVTIDYLMSGGSGGIAFAGNIITDIVKVIDEFPECGMLAKIQSVSRATGGCVPNTAIDIAKIDDSMPLYAIGRVGDDENGRFTFSQLQKYGINTSCISVSNTTSTSFCDVMSNSSTGERTFFSLLGANSEFSPQDIDIDNLNCLILHAGYLLMLDKFDAVDDEYGTVMARFLHNVRERGIKTSIDVVSDSSKRFKEKIVPSLKYCDYAIMNEIEACGVSELDPRRSDGSLNKDNIIETLKIIAEFGVYEKVIIHCPEAGFCLDCQSGRITVIGSLILPSGWIKSSVGAGDAFCAGCLYGIYHSYTDEDMLEFAAAAAACSLTSFDSVGGVRSKKDIIKISQQYKYSQI